MTESHLRTFILNYLDLGSSVVLSNQLHSFSLKVNNRLVRKFPAFVDSVSFLWCLKQSTFGPEHDWVQFGLSFHIYSVICTLISPIAHTTELSTKMLYLLSNSLSLLNHPANIGWTVQVTSTNLCNFIHISISLLLMFRLFTFPRCMEECVESRDWCVKRLCWILMRESVSVGTLFLNARNCFLRLRVVPSPCLRVSFGCWLLEKFQMKPRYDIEYYGADISVLLVFYFDRAVADLKEWWSVALLSGKKCPISDTLNK